MFIPTNIILIYYLQYFTNKLINSLINYCDKLIAYAKFYVGQLKINRK